ncbi:MAG: hypothetical protein HIU83_14200 [Proteobacteria bacterium]|nr:hypothetical protein [Pseudomonadota bacterium]
MLRKPIPPGSAQEVEEARLKLTEAVADFDEGVMADFLEGKRVAAEHLRSELRKGTLDCAFYAVRDFRFLL